MRPDNLSEPYPIEPFWKRIDWFEVFLIGSAVLCSIMIVFGIIATILFCLSIF